MWSLSQTQREERKGFSNVLGLQEKTGRSVSLILFLNPKVRRHALLEEKDRTDILGGFHSESCSSRQKALKGRKRLSRPTS